MYIRKKDFRKTLELAVRELWHSEQPGRTSGDMKLPEICLSGEPIFGTSEADLARLGAGLLIFAKKEGATSLELDYCSNQIWVTLADDRVECAPVPAPDLVDLTRKLLSCVGIKPGAMENRPA